MRSRIATGAAGKNATKRVISFSRKLKLWRFAHRVRVLNLF